MKFLEYDETGEIGGCYDVPEWEVEHNPFYRSMRLVLAGEEEVASPTHYVRDGAVVLRPAIAATLEAIPGGFRLRGLPVPCTVSVGGEIYQVDDGEFEWITPLPGVYQVEVRAWPSREWRREVEVSAT